MAKFTIVGIDDPYNKTPLQPDIINSSGQRVWAMTGMPMRQYCQFFTRRNLFRPDEPHDITTAMIKAKVILNSLDTRFTGNFIICLGQIVAKGFGISRPTPLKFISIRQNIWAAYLTHTSGLNRWYNSADNVNAAKQFMKTVAAAASGKIDDDDIYAVLAQF